MWDTGRQKKARLWGIIAIFAWRWKKPTDIGLKALLLRNNIYISLNSKFD